VRMQNVSPESTDLTHLPHSPSYQPIHQNKAEIENQPENTTQIEFLQQQIDDLQRQLNAAKNSTSNNTNNHVANNAANNPANNVVNNGTPNATSKQVEPVPPVSADKKQITPILKPKTVTPPAITVSTSPAGLVVVSDDPDTLDQLEELIRLLSDESFLSKTSLVVYYLKNSTAEVVGPALQSLLGTSTAPLGVSGTGTINTPAGLEYVDNVQFLGLLSDAGSIDKTGPVSISPNPRLNALLIQANPIDHKTIERLLAVLDQPTPPGDAIATRTKVRLIPLKNMRAEDALSLVEKIFANQIQGGNNSGNSGGGQNQGGNSGGRGGSRGSTTQNQTGGAAMPMPQGMPPGAGGGMAMLQQMMSQMGGGRQSATPREQEPPMTLGTDSRSNSLIVTSSESTFREVEEFVLELDALAFQSQTKIDVQVVRTKVNPEMLKQAIGNMTEGKVSFSTAPRSSTGGNFGSGFGGNNAFGGGGTNRFGGGATGFGGGFGGNSAFGGQQRATNPFLNMLQGGGGGGFGGIQRMGGGNTGGNTGGQRPRFGN
ncbi:MAG: secretin N-terminal domain-containing protein, partial [Thermoguttaceae bacterium]